MGFGLGGLERLQQLASGASDPGADCTDRNAEDVGSLVVTQPGQLGEHERRTPIFVELVQQLVDLRAVADRGRVVEYVMGHADNPLFGLATPAAASGGVGAGSPGDREQPMTRWTARPEAVKRGKRPLVGLLCEVVGVVPVAQIAAQRHHIVLGRRDEALERLVVAALGGQQERRQLIHAESFCHGNQTLGYADRHIVEPSSPTRASDCAGARLLISAATDDELHRDERLRLDNHLGDCSSCRAHAEAVASLTRTVRLRSAEYERDFVNRVMTRSRPERLGRGGWLRPALAWCGVVIAGQSVRPLVFAQLDGATTHIARHVGASALALAIGLLYAAWRPHRAFGLLPFVGALLLTTAVSTLLDTIGGNRSALAEAVHVAEIVGLVLLWMVAGSPGWDRLRYKLRLLGRHQGAARPTS